MYAEGIRSCSFHKSRQLLLIIVMIAMIFKEPQFFPQDILPRERPRV